MAKFNILLTVVIFIASLIVNHATVRLPEWPGIPPKGYNGNVAKRLPEWSGIPPKGNEDEKAKRLPEWPGIPPKGYNGQKAKRLPEWPGIPPKGYNGQLTTERIAPSANANNADAPYGDEAWPDASSPRSTILLQ